MPRPRFGTIPRHRLAAARAARDALREPAAAVGAAARVTLVPGGFGVLIEYPPRSPVTPEDGSIDGVPLRIRVRLAPRPRR